MIARHGWTGAVLPVLFGLLLMPALPARAQYDEDEQTKDHETQDRRYQGRVEIAEDAPENLEQAELEFLEKVDRLIRDRNHRAADGERYRVQTDDPRLEPEAIVAFLDEFRRYFDGFWSERIELQDYEKQSRIFLFYSFYKYNQLLGGDFRFSPIRPRGHYGSLFDVVTLHTDASGTAGDFADTLIHEAAHQLVDQRFPWNGNDTPSWLAEGLASYFGYTRQDDSGEFRAGEVGRKTAGLFRGKDGGGSRPLGVDVRLKTVRRALKERDPSESLVERIVWMQDPSRFYGGDPNLTYGLSWVLVHYLLHGNGGEPVDGLFDYLEGLMNGDDAPDRLFERLEMTPEQLDEALTRHAKGLKPR